MKNLFSIFVIIAMVIFSSVGVNAAQPKKKRVQKTKTTATMTPKRLIELIENKESTKITDIASLASEIDRAKSITTGGIDKLISSKYPAYINKSLDEKLSIIRKDLEKYISNNAEYNTTNAGMTAGAYALCAYSDYTSLALMGTLLDKMPTEEAHHKFLEFGVQLSIFQNNAANFTYYHAGFDAGFGSMLSLFSASAIDDINIGVRKMFQADLKALTSGTPTSSANPTYLFKKFFDKNSTASLDQEFLEEYKDSFEDAYRDYNMVQSNLEADFTRLTEAHRAWLDTLPRQQADAMANSLSIMLEACLNIQGQ